MKSGQDEGDKSGQRMREDEGAAERHCSCAAALVVEIKLDSNCLRMALMRMMLMNWCVCVVWFGKFGFGKFEGVVWVDGAGVILVCG